MFFLLYVNIYFLLQFQPSNTNNLAGLICAGREVNVRESLYDRYGITLNNKYNLWYKLSIFSTPARVCSVSILIFTNAGDMPLLTGSGLIDQRLK